MNGSEHFFLNGQETEMSMIDFWRWHFSDIFDLQDKIAEFIVAKALGNEKPDNVGVWTLYDISYRGLRLEVKETSYYHSWQTDEEEKSQARIFGITKAYSEYKDNTSTYERQNDIYVFCLNIGETKESSNPLKLENWEFYVVPTTVINRECKDAKTVSLSRVRKFTDVVTYDGLKSKIDEVVEWINDGKVDRS